MRSGKVFRVLAMAVVGLLGGSSSIRAELPIRGHLDPDTIGFVYDPGNGYLGVYNRHQIQMTTIELKSRGHLFRTGRIRPPLFNGIFDVYRPDKLFKMDPDGFTEFEVQSILPAGLGPVELTSDLTVDGSALPQSPSGTRVKWVLCTDACFVPEPTGILLALGLVLCSVGPLRRQTRSCPRT